ncbi:MAG: hypothetical protein Q7S66_02465 [bacterium]|nr:hypothetical protein [bacterium]
MKNNKFLLILIPIFFWIITILLGIQIRQNLHDDILGNTRSIFYVFVTVNIVHFFYFLYIFYLRLKKRTKTVILLASLPTTVVCLVLLVSYTFITEGRARTLNLGPDPFVPSTDITSYRRVPLWSIDYWITDKMYNEKYRDKQVAQMQKTRQGSLIGHIGTDLQGWIDEKIVTAFGEPVKIIQVNENLEKWIYHPWTNHLDWEMPVYVQNGALLKIGD